MVLGSIKLSALVPLIYDGVSYEHQQDDSGGNSGGARISARHNKFSVCNVVFADGHVAGLRLDELPGGKTLVNELGSVTKLDARNSSVHWMLAQ